MAIDFDEAIEVVIKDEEIPIGDIFTCDGAYDVVFLTGTTANDIIFTDLDDNQSTKEGPHE